jgi:hypothetical protein
MGSSPAVGLDGSSKPPASSHRTPSEVDTDASTIHPGLETASHLAKETDDAEAKNSDVAANQDRMNKVHRRESLDDADFDVNDEDDAHGQDLEKAVSRVRSQPLPGNDDHHPDPEENDPDIVDWDGPDDPRNPMNWPRWMKVLNCAVISSYTFVTPLASGKRYPNGNYRFGPC